MDSYGNAKAGIVNWNTCIVYPDGPSIQEITVQPSVTLPEGWKQASSMTANGGEGARVDFAPLTLEAFVDSPMLCGEHLRDVELDVKDFPPVTLHLLSESASALNLDEKLIGQYATMCNEAGALFGGAHFDHYALLLAMSNDFPYTGLEHLRSSLNAVGERDLFDEKQVQGWVGYLVPHEFVHSWCGKYRRPAGMATADFHTAKHTNLLWVYEGLTQYLGHVLTVRAGIWELDHYREVLAQNVANYMRQTGRGWRPLEDTAIDSYHLRGGSAAWSRMRRGQDYYSEGLLIWLEADAIIRNLSGGKRSLDDFCKAFMGPDGPDQEVYPYTEDDVIAALNGVEAYDWAAFVDARVKQTQPEYPLDFIGELGYRLQFASKPSGNLEEREKDRNYVYALDSLGINVSSEGKVYGDVVPGMPGDAAGLSPGTQIIGVNGRTYSNDRLRDAIADSVTKRQIELLVAQGDVLETITLDYDGGPKYLELIRDGDKPDRLAEILTPRITDQAPRDE